MCDTSPPPELLPDFAPGTLDEKGFIPTVRSFIENPPPVIEEPSGITRRDPAERWGDRKGDLVYFPDDLIASK